MSRTYECADFDAHWIPAIWNDFTLYSEIENAHKPYTFGFIRLYFVYSV